jgi:hypothetical protein
VLQYLISPESVLPTLFDGVKVVKNEIRNKFVDDHISVLLSLTVATFSPHCQIMRYPPPTPLKHPQQLHYPPNRHSELRQKKKKKKKRKKEKKEKNKKKKRNKQAAAQRLC